MVHLVEPRLDDRPLVDRLAQLYAHDFSEMVEIKLGSNGLFPAHECFTEIWTDPNRHARLIMVDAEVAGFAIVQYIPEESIFDMEQFFVLRKFRMARVGQKVAHQLFAEFSGDWEVEQIDENPIAKKFWRKVITEYTGGDFRETMGEFLVQSFKT